ncbi:hypothetical protein SAICODRAFT_29472 [Saitoella complicata NRRL Y-17804]|nr:uncharacterized protein SAICODRAFT_29472 [Saitoella complicata NRRL Y-17804]ODQ54299.1 hypothetical protein SAICODRAFT_29472 [Saitoella complicata NRRL Y-17804]
MVAGASTKRPWYNLGIMMLTSSGELEGVEVLFATMKQEGIQRNEHSWKPYIIALNKSGRSGDAFEAFREFDKEVSDATSASYYSMMNSFLRVGAIHHAHEVFVAMRAKGHKPDDATIMLLLRQTDQDSPTSIDQKTKVIQEHMESTSTLSEDPEFYLTALKFFIGLRQPTQAVQILDRMRERKVAISAAHINLIIKMYLQQHDLQNALGWFHRMNATGSDQHGLEYPLPDMESYALFIEEVSQRKFPMPPGCGSRLDFIINWTRAMSEARIPFATRVVNAVLAAMLRNDQFNNLWKTWKFMVGERGVVPDIGTYSILWVSQVHVSWHGRKAWPEEIMAPREFFRLMLHSSVAPTVRTYDLILKTFLRLGDTAGAIVALGVMSDRQTINADQGTVAAVAYGIGRKSVVARGIWYEDGVRSMVTTLGLLDKDHNILKRDEGVELSAKDIQLFLMRTFSKTLGRFEAEEIVHQVAMEMEVAGIRLNWQDV